jgi:hypothetical protein
MALSEQIIALIRDEIGNDTDFSNDIPHTSPQLDSLERIYMDTERGNLSILRTALICWRRRRHNLQARSWDIATEGSLLSRSQRLRQMDQQIKRLEVLVDSTYSGRNQQIQSPLAAEEAASLSAEFS